MKRLQARSGCSPGTGTNQALADGIAEDQLRHMALLASPNLGFHAGEQVTVVAVDIRYPALPAATGPEKRRAPRVAKLEKRTKIEAVPAPIAGRAYELAVAHGYRPKATLEKRADRRVEGVAKPIDLTPLGDGTCISGTDLDRPARRHQAFLDEHRRRRECENGSELPHDDHEGGVHGMKEA